MYRRNRIAVINCLGIACGNLIIKKSINQSISKYVTLKKENLEVAVLQIVSGKQPSNSQPVTAGERLAGKPVELGVNFTNSANLLKELNQQSGKEKNVNFAKATQIFEQIEKM